MIESWWGYWLATLWIALLRLIMKQKTNATLPETHIFASEMDVWNTIVSFRVSAYFQGRTVSSRECRFSNVPQSPIVKIGA